MTQGDGEWRFHNYVVILFDLLGQSIRLADLDRMPATESEEAQYRQVVRETWGRVYQMRRCFQIYIEALRSHPVDLTRVPEGMRESYRESTTQRLITYGLSDSTVIAVPLLEGNLCSRVNSIHSALVATGVIAHLLLSQRIPCRGGIELGVAAQVGENEVYGSALAHAHRIEKEIAGYPRVVIGERLVDSLRSVAASRPTDEASYAAQRMAVACLEILAEDTDGHIIVNYISPQVMNASGGLLGEESVQAVRDFARSEHMRFVTASNNLLADRYAALVRFVDLADAQWLRRVPDADGV